MRPAFCVRWPPICRTACSAMPKPLHCRIPSPVLWSSGPDLRRKRPARAPTLPSRHWHGNSGISGGKNIIPAGNRRTGQKTDFCVQSCSRRRRERRKRSGARSAAGQKADLIDQFVSSSVSTLHLTAIIDSLKSCTKKMPFPAASAGEAESVPWGEERQGWNCRAAAHSLCRNGTLPYYNVNFNLTI